MIIVKMLVLTGWGVIGRECKKPRMGGVDE
jgi:hypothetical protein